MSELCWIPVGAGYDKSKKSFYGDEIQAGQLFTIISIANPDRYKDSNKPHPQTKEEWMEFIREFYTPTFILKAEFDKFLLEYKPISEEAYCMTTLNRKYVFEKI